MDAPTGSLKWKHCGKRGLEDHRQRLGILTLLLLVGTGIVFATGGTSFAFAYVMLVPVLLAAAWFTLAGGLMSALAAGTLMAFMPQDVVRGIPQDVSNYLIRAVFYLLLGGVAGWLFHKQRQASARHRTLVRTDPHSGLANQVALHEDLGQCLSQPAGGGMTAVMLVRITDLADVVEALGLEASDELVLSIGTRLYQAVRGGDEAYRVSHDEVALLFRDLEVEDLEGIGQRLATVGEESLTIRQVPVRVQLAIGSAIARDKTTEPSALLREARIALLAAMRLRRSHTHFSPSFDQRTLASLTLIAKVRAGLNEDQFEVHYQPKIRLTDGQVSGCEGLIRWRDHDGNLIPPGQFMPKVETTSLIGPVTHFVVQAAVAMARQDEGAGTVSINLSVHNLLDDQLHTLLHDLTGQSGMRPERLEVEITESALIGDVEAARRAIQHFRDLGIGVSIDDFGTGFASFEYLQHLPITGLKIDRAFVAHLEEDERARKLMACMIDVGHALDLVVTAEGVETSQQEEILRQLGCDQVQGFHYAPALPAPAFQAWCQRRIDRSR